MSDQFRLAVSIGHGYKKSGGTLVPDPGAKNAAMSFEEHKIVVKIWRVLKALLDPDRRFDVIEIPIGLPLQDRVDAINRANEAEDVDLAVELHLNANTDPLPDYPEIYHFASASGVSSVRGKRYGDAMLPAYVEAFGRDGKRDGLSEPFGDEDWESHRNYFCTYTAPPALILEPFFITNNERAQEVVLGGLVSETAIATYRGLVLALDAEG